jgi:hypothetical protein
MRIALAIAVLGVLAMGSVLAFAFVRGDFAGEGSVLISMPWGIVSLVDLYVGFTLFSAWVVYREQSVSRSVVWVILIMILGFFSASLYVLLALLRCRGDWKRFWMGNRTPA